MLARRIDDAVEHADASFPDAARGGNWPDMLPCDRERRVRRRGATRAQPAETVNSLDSVPTLELLLGQGGNRRLEVDAAVRAGNLGTDRAHHLVEGPDKLRYVHGPEGDLSALVLGIGN